MIEVLGGPVVDDNIMKIFVINRRTCKHGDDNGRIR